MLYFLEKGTADIQKREKTWCNVEVSTIGALHVEFEDGTMFNTGFADLIGDIKRYTRLTVVTDKGVIVLKPTSMWDVEKGRPPVPEKWRVA